MKAKGSANYGPPCIILLHFRLSANYSYTSKQCTILTLLNTAWYHHSTHQSSQKDDSRVCSFCSHSNSLSALPSALCFTLCREHFLVCSSCVYAEHASSWKRWRCVTKLLVFFPVKVFPHARFVDIDTDTARWFLGGFVIYETIRLSTG